MKRGRISFFFEGKASQKKMSRRVLDPEKKNDDLITFIQALKQENSIKMVYKRYFLVDDYDDQIITYDIKHFSTHHLHCDKLY